MKRSSINFGKLIAITIAAWILVEACVEFYNVAWGTGKAVGLFSPRWLILFVSFVLLLCGVILAECQGAKLSYMLLKSITFLKCFKEPS